MAIKSIGWARAYDPGGFTALEIARGLLRVTKKAALILTAQNIGKSPTIVQPQELKRYFRLWICPGHSLERVCHPDGVLILSVVELKCLVAKIFMRLLLVTGRNL